MVLDQMAKDPTSRQGPKTIHKGILFDMGIVLTRCQCMNLMYNGTLKLLRTSCSGITLIMRCICMMLTDSQYMNPLQVEQFFKLLWFQQGNTMNGVPMVIISYWNSDFWFGGFTTSGPERGWDCGLYQTTVWRWQLAIYILHWSRNLEVSILLSFRDPCTH